METSKNHAQEAGIVELAEDGSAFTTSLIVAEAFGKRHKNVLQAIDKLDCSAEFCGLNFLRADYVDAQRERRYLFQISRDAFAFLVSVVSSASFIQRASMT